MRECAPQYKSIYRELLRWDKGISRNSFRPERSQKFIYRNRHHHTHHCLSILSSNCHYHHHNHHYLSLSSSQPPPSITIIVCHDHYHNHHHLWLSSSFLSSFMMGSAVELPYSPGCGKSWENLSGTKFTSSVSEKIYRQHWHLEYKERSAWLAGSLTSRIPNCVRICGDTRWKGWIQSSTKEKTTSK